MSSVVLYVADQHTLQSLGYWYLFVCNSGCLLSNTSPSAPIPSVGTVANSVIPLPCAKTSTPHAVSVARSMPPGTTLVQLRIVEREAAVRMHRCVNYNNNLRASVSPLYPARAKVRQRKQDSETITEFDSSIQLEPTN